VIEDPVETLQRLAQEKHNEVTTWLANLNPYDRRALFIEVCRALDYEQVRQMSEIPEHKLPYPDFDLMLRGWNETVVAMLTPDFQEDGIPARPSTHDSLRVGRSILHEMGLSSLLRKTASMVQHGMAEIASEGDTLFIRSLNFATSDHFLDQIDIGALPKLNEPVRSASYPAPKSKEEIQQAMEDLVFPWNGAPGVTMVGYGATPDIDAYFLSATADQMLDWRNEAGIHPDTDALGTSGGLLTGITGLLASIFLKHIRFVGIGHKKMQDINFAVSLTLWEPRSDLIDSMSTFIGGDASEVSLALDKLTVTANDTRYFAATEKPYIPLLIQISNVHVLRPIASIFRNPLHGARMMLEFNTPASEASFRAPREAWMRQELNLLFLGTRCQMLGRPAIIKHKGKTLTDIDAGVYHPDSRCLALFQLKWQDFGAAEVKRQKSRAKNFVSQVDTWTEKMETWIADVGLDGVAKALHLGGDITSVRLFAVGRFAARFKSYGYNHAPSSVAVCSWPQLSRIRKQLNTDNNILQSIYEGIIKERSRAISVTAIPYEVKIGDNRLVFHNIWNNFDEEEAAT
jgi:hypothetical protein